MDNVTLARYRNTDYTVRCEIDGNMKVYTWKGSAGNRIDKKSVPKAVVDWLNMNSVCFEKGKLVIEGKEEEVTEITQDFADEDTYKNNIHTREEIEEALLGHHMTLNKLLDSITVDDEKRFVVDIAIELKDNLTGKRQDQLAEWSGIDKGILFD